MKWEKELEAAKCAAVEAGKAIMDIYQGADQTLVEYKADQSPLTIADQAANKIIVDFLRKTFPQYAILSEIRNQDWRMIIVLLWILWMERKNF